MGSLNRVIMRKSFKELMRTIGIENLDVAEISGKAARNLPVRSYSSYWYPDYDVCAGPMTDADGQAAQYDLIVADQVWEHLDRPYRATQNVIASLRPGGFFYVAVPFFVPMHAAPVDNTRWSARGLKNFLVECGFDEDNVASWQWGNRWAGVRNAVGPFPPQFERGRDPLTNEEDWPVVAWALAQKSV